jgi:hypothetical protein
VNNPSNFATAVRASAARTVQEFRLCVRHALTDIAELNFLINKLREASGIGQVTGSIRAILPVDAVAFHPRITINEIEKWKALKDLHNSRLQIFLTNLFLIHAPSDIS